MLEATKVGDQGLQGQDQTAVPNRIFLAPDVLIRRTPPCRNTGRKLAPLVLLSVDRRKQEWRRSQPSCGPHLHEEDVLRKGDGGRLQRHPPLSF